MDALTAADPVKNELTSVMAAWEAAVGLNKRTTVAAIMRNIETPPLPKAGSPAPQHRPLARPADRRPHPLARTRSALNATTERGGKITGSDLGNWLRRHSNRIAGGRRFVSQTGSRPRPALVARRVGCHRIGLAVLPVRKPVTGEASVGTGGNPAGSSVRIPIVVYASATVFGSRR